MKQERLQQLLLERARKTDNYMADIIEWYIDIGIRLEKNSKTGYMIYPIIDEDHWSSQDEWEQEKQWLVPYYKIVLMHLRNIRKEEENAR